MAAQPSQPQHHSQAEQNPARTAPPPQHRSRQLPQLHPRPYQLHSQAQHPHFQHAAPSFQVQPANNNGATGVPIYAPHPRQQQQSQSHPQQQQQHPNPYGNIQLIHGNPYPTVAAIAVPAGSQPSHSIPEPTQAGNSRQSVSTNSVVAHEVPQKNPASVLPYHSELLQMANQRAHAVLQKFGAPQFGALWKCMHSMVSAESFSLSTGYSLEIERLRNEVNKARQSEQQAKEKQECAIRDSESIMEKARQWKTRLDETTAKLITLQGHYRMVLQVALQQNKLLDLREEKNTVMGDSSLYVTSQASTEYLQKQVVDLENRLKKFEKGSVFTPDDMPQQDLEPDCTSKSPTICGSPTIQNNYTTGETDHTSDSVKQQLKNEVDIVAELIEQKVAPALPITADAVKLEPLTRASEQTLLSEPFSIDLTGDDLDLTYMNASPSPSSSSLAQVPSNLSPLSPESLLGMASSVRPTADPLSSTVVPPPTSLPSNPEENVLKHINEDDNGEERPLKRLCSQRSGPSSTSPSTATSCSFRSTYFQPSENTAPEPLPQESSKDGELLDGTTAPEVTDVLKSQNPLGESHYLERTKSDVSTALDRDDSNTVDDGAEESDFAPELNSMHMEILYHKSSKFGEYRCRLCLLEADAGWLAKEAAVVFPANVERDDMVLHSATAHTQSLIGLLRTDKAELISTIRKLYNSDMS
ncbi:hypothetical protein EW145_g382 [Phellinidium pouzarii]|uniref:Uncharacterized protein n=1 Tax=Phellinidium pouzarii TaxID=167371 RepID=A0A4V3XE10_9AGAM|nr:hypothetical protein EW145_g382 [Phellinidium pouzarii]